MPAGGILRLDPQSLRVLDDTPFLLDGESSVVAGFGAVWVTSGRDLIRLDPRSGKIEATISMNDALGAAPSDTSSYG